jgi:endothelin-converting enzyme/putative endopeptidase
MNPSRALLALALLCAARSALALTVSLDPGASAPEPWKVVDADTTMRRLLGPAATRTVDGAKISYQSASWSAEVQFDERARLVASLRAAWGARFVVLDDAGAPLVVVPSSKHPSEKALGLLTPDALNGQHGKVYDGSAEHSGAVAAPPSGVVASGLTKPARTATNLPVFDPSAMDNAVDPCTDFYHYACGTWLKNNPVPPDRTTWMRFTQLDEQTLVVLKSILEDAASAADAARKTADQKKIGALYTACMDQTGADAKGATPLKGDLAAIEAVSSKKGLASVVASQQLLGAGPLFGFGSGQDYQNAEKMIAVVDQGGLSLPDRDFYLKDEFAPQREGFVKHVAKMFVLLGDAPAAADAEAARVMAVETGLAKISDDTTARREPAAVHHKTTLAALAKLCPAFDWAAYLKVLGAPAKGPADDSAPNFFKGLNALIASTDLASWKSYLRWQLVHAQAGLLSSSFVDENFAFFGKALNGQQELTPRWKRCVGLVDGKLGDALGKEYAAQEFGPTQKAQTLAMVREIETSMAADIKAVGWMSPATKTKALEKLAKVANKIGYPDKWKDYSKLSVDSGDLAGDASRANAFEFKRQLAMIGKPVDRGEWGMTAPTDNDYYDSQLNSVNFPAGSLQPPLFDANAPAAANFGAVGATMGHELTHGFDDEGRHYDAFGNLKDWWTKADSAGFDKRAQGIADQYSQYYAVRDPKNPANDVHVNGQLSLGENLADDGGLRLSYAAYKRRTEPDGAVGNFSGDKLFFLSYGQSWCGNQTPESARVQAASDPHAPPEARVNGVVSNNLDFRRTFACREGSPMAPATVNRVW